MLAPHHPCNAGVQPREQGMREVHLRTAFQHLRVKKSWAPEGEQHLKW